MPASGAAARGAIHHGHRDRWRVPIVALLVGVNILRTGYTLLRRSLIGLLDAALPADDVAKAEAVIDRYRAEDGVGFGALRTRESGRQRFVYVTMTVPPAGP
jgi:divalent metal cation (Fe/Co/Zn/Cd) transporter